MAIEIIGEGIYSEDGKVFVPGVATFFPDTGTLVTKGTTHFLHREIYCDWLEEERRMEGLEPLTASQRSKIWKSGVDLIILPHVVLIRPDPEQIDRVLAADELLHEIVNKRRIRFQLASNAKVRGALTERGELWRIASAAVTTDEMQSRVKDARMRLGGRAIYYYSPPTGTRFLTLNELKNLGSLDVDELRQHLVEIQTNCDRYSNRGGLEVDFFLGLRALRTTFLEANFTTVDEETLRAEHQRLCTIFEENIPPHLRFDNLDEAAWLQEMYDTLYPLQEDASDAAKHLGLAPEFHKHVKWLPGGRLKKWHLEYDPVLDESNGPLPDELRHQENRRARAIILNFVRDYGDLEHINIGWINESLSRSNRPPRGQRDVYVVEMKRASEQHRQVRILRMQKWDMTHRTNRTKSLELAMFQTEEYTEYTQDRYLGCRRLGMNLFGPVHVGRISEMYTGVHQEIRGKQIWTPYFERAYVDGIASDRITKERLNRPGYAERFAQLLGHAAAANIIVGRGDGDPGESDEEKLIVFFDDGDEIVREEDDMIKELIVAHHTGSFWYFDQPLGRFAHAYARPVLRRANIVPDPRAFAQIYLDSMIQRFTEVQREYREERRAFEQLFQARRVRNKGNFVDRWECVLKRLDETNPQELRQAISACLQRKERTIFQAVH